MRLDQTQIAIRQRGLLETLDLALHVLRRFGTPLARCALAVIVPLAIWNEALVGWMARLAAEEERFPLEYLFSMALLIYVEAPLVAAACVAYLGPAVFGDDRPLRQVLGALVRRSGAWLVVHGLARAMVPAWLVLLGTDRLAGLGPLGVMGLVTLAMGAGLVRALRPYINEVLLLEQVTLGADRSGRLHRPVVGELLGEGMVLAVLGGALSVSVTVAALLVWGVLLNDWPVYRLPDSDELRWNLVGLKLRWVYPLSLWLVAVYLAVVRFLRYLDLRIRNEGWEVELQLRAEGRQLSAELA
jgi:hypothetical protein